MITATDIMYGSLRGAGELGLVVAEKPLSGITEDDLIVGLGTSFFTMTQPFAATQSYTGQSQPAMPAVPTPTADVTTPVIAPAGGSNPIVPSYTSYGVLRPTNFFYNRSGSASGTTMATGTQEPVYFTPPLRNYEMTPPPAGTPGGKTVMPSYDGNELPQSMTDPSPDPWYKKPLWTGTVTVGVAVVAAVGAVLLLRR